MRKLIVVLALVLAGCATQPDYSYLRSDEPLTHFMTRFEPPYSVPEFPHRHWERLEANAEDRLPLLEPGTPYAEVIDALVARGLEPIPVTRANAIVVRQGPSLRNFGMADAVHAVYAFDGERLAFGPSDADDLGRRLTEEDFDDNTLQLLTSLDEIEPISAQSLNDIAWELATHPLPNQRYPALALSIAERAANDSGYADYFIVDTLAAAYAAVGDFENAVNFQETAIVLADGEDPEMDDRLSLFRENQAFAQYSGGVTDEQPFPLIQRASNGEAEALYQLGMMCVERPISPCLGDDPDAFRWIEAAAALDHEISIDIMAYTRLIGGINTHRDISEGLAWLKKGIENESAVAAWHTATASRHQIGLDRDDEMITELMLQAADADIWDAALEVGYRLIEGIGVDPDPETGESYIAMARDAGIDVVDLIFFDAVFFFERVGDPTAIDLIDHRPEPVRSIPSRLLALGDDLLAQANEGRTTVTARFERYHVGWPAEDAEYAALQLIRNAARLGSADAQRRMARYYNDGLIVDKSDSDASYWRERAKQNLSGL